MLNTLKQSRGRAHTPCFAFCEVTYADRQRNGYLSKISRSKLTGAPLRP